MAIKILNGIDVVGSMNITASDIPSLDANKITTGTLAAARIPSLDASKIGSGTFAASRIPNLDGSKITTGTIAAARIADLSATYATVSSVPTNVSDLTNDIGYLSSLPSHNHDDRYYTETEIDNITHQWEWKWHRWNGYIAPAADNSVDWTTYYKTYFTERTAAIDAAHVLQGEGYVNTIDNVDSNGGFGGSTYGNIFGNLSSYHALIYTNIYVEHEFTVNVTNFNGDDPHAIFIDGVFVHGRIPCCTDTAYNYTFTKGWHRIDLIYSEGGGGDYIRMGWNPKDYLANISDMTPHRAGENPRNVLAKLNALGTLATESFVTSRGYITGVAWGDVTGKPTLDNYVSWNLKTNSVQRTTVGSGGDLNLVAGTNVTLAYSAGGTVTISSTDTNTDTNNYLTGLSFNTGDGVLTATRQGLGNLTVDLDGRYLQLGGGTVSGNVHLNGEVRLGNFTGNDVSEWPKVYWYRDTPNGWDEGLIKADSSRGFFNKSHYGIHFDATRAFGFFTSSWTKILGMDNTKVHSSVNLVVDGTISASGYNDSNWNTAYSWGNHASAGYLTSYTESDTLQSVTSRGNSTTTNIHINNTNPTLYLQDTDHRSAMIHVNSDTFYILNGSGDNSTAWAQQANGRWLFSGNLNTNNITFGGNGDFAGDGVFEGGRLKINNANHGAWDDGVMIDDPSGWAATIYRRSNAPKMFTGLRSGTDNFIWMSPLYNNTGTVVAAPRTDAVLEVKTTNRLEVYLPTDFGQDVTAPNLAVSNWNTAYSWGNHAGLYAAASHTHSYLPLGGGTLSGNLNISKDNPILILNETNASSDAGQIAYISFQDNGAEEAWIGWGSNGNTDFTIRNVIGKVVLNGGGGAYVGNARILTTSDSSSFATASHNHDSSYINVGGDTMTGILKLNAGVTNNNWSTFTHLEGAYSVNNPSGTGGAIRIELPVAEYLTNTMMTMTVKVYEYSTGKSFTLFLGGYNYSNGVWYNTFASMVGDNERGDVPVKFGQDGTRNIIWIGNPDWSWSYPNVWVTDFQSGHTQGQDWNDGWRIIFDQAEAVNVTATRTAYKQITTGNIGSQTAANAGQLDGIDSSQFMRSDVNDSFTAKPTFANGATGTLASRTGFSDFLGYNPTYGSYIGGGVGNAGRYIYAGGYFYDGTSARTLFHTGNFTDNSTNWNTAYSWGNHASAGYITSLAGYATETYVGQQISNLVASAPSTLDTLNELAAALGDDPNFATTVTNSIATKLPLTGGTLTGDLRFNQGSGYGRIAFVDNYHGMVLRGYPNNATGSISVGDVTSLIQHSGDFRFYRTNGSINELYFQVNSTAAYHRGNQIWDTSDFTSTNVSNWNTAYGWGNHASAGYLTGITSSQVTTALGYTPLSTTGKAADSDLLDGIDSTGFVRALSDASNPNYQTPSSRRVNPNVDNPTNEHYAVSTFGNSGNVTGQIATHFITGRLYSRGYNSSWSQWRYHWDDEDFSSTDIFNWNTAYGWGNHASAGYLTSFDITTQTDPKYVRSDVYDTTFNGLQIHRDIGSNNGSWTDGDHTLGLETQGTGNIVINFHRAGHTSHNLRYNGSQFRFDDDLESTGVITASGGNSTNWNTAYGWGNHATAGYLTSYSETDTLASVTARGASTTTTLSVRNVTARNITPEADRLYLLGSDSARWQIVYCEILDSAGQHEKNLQNPEGEKSIADYETGTVLVWKGGKNIPCTKAADHMRMGIAVKGIDSPLIQGAEPVLVTGAVKEGDYLVTSTKEGHAEAISPEFMRQHNLFDCVLGKALEDGDGESHLVKTWINI